MTVTCNQRRNFRKTMIRATMRPMIETMEQRALMSVSFSGGSSITEITDYSLCATARIGDNGDPWGLASVVSQTATEYAGSAINEWDSNLANGLDSGWVDFAFSADMASGAMSWAVVGADTITYVGNVGTGVSNVEIQAGVTSGGMAFAFSNMSVKFYSGDTLIDTETFSDGPAVDTMSAQTSSAAESRAVVTPGASTCDKVIITGSIRLQAAQGVSAIGEDVFGKIYIHDVA